MKSFNVFITEMNEGANNAALTGHMHELLTAVMHHGLAGKLKITISVLPTNRGGGPVDKVFIECDSQLTLPKPAQPRDIFFLTEDAEPTRKHPRQYEMELRDVSIAAARPATAQASATDQFVSGVKFSAPDADGVVQPLAQAASQPITLKDASQ